MAQKVEVKGGKGGNQWDDGSEHDAVTKIQAAASGNGIQYVKFDYVKSGKTEEAPLRGVKGHSIAAYPHLQFVINNPEEHLVSVEGWYNPEGLIQGLKFKSNKKTFDVIGYEDGTPFRLQFQDKKIIGFHGFAGDYVHSLGAYFAPLLTSSTPLIPPIKQEAGGGTGGASWDDGVHDGVRKVHVGQGQDGVSSINIVYKKGSQEVGRGEHGKKRLLGFETFEVDEDDYIVAVQVTHDKVYVLGFETFEVDEDDYIVAVQVTHDKVYGQVSDIITSLTFYTFKGKTSPPYGLETENKFLLKGKNGGKLVGFHGRAGEALHALGAYFATTTTPLTPLTPPPKKLLAIGGDKGNAWDDNAYDGVKKVYVGQAQDGVSVVKFVYDKDAQDIVGGEHGKSTLLGFEEVLRFYFISKYILYLTIKEKQLAMSILVYIIWFKTNKKTSSPFGLEAGTAFALKEEGHKIVGFHGKASELLHQFGVHVMPITN
ncbi:PREDICTED: jacalin-related lectin 33-like [Camelina sativa]|uniref:Jacalin-related lectin 33-like n=1 Tax=Camelina sativa TaxID=90675 RepID=A0ABM1RPX6_CAMSA|nr:PREDICTED: jacalin-related lectin 33-like [Camelina sativa]